MQKVVIAVAIENQNKLFITDAKCVGDMTNE